MTLKVWISALIAAALTAIALADEPQPACPPVKVCVPEPKHNTKVVYTSRCKDYCLPCCSLWHLLCGRCTSCDAGNCGAVRTKSVLVKKKVPACDTTQCVVKELSPGCEPAGPPAPADPAKGSATPAPKQ